MNDEKQLSQERIEAYINGTLSLDEVKLFEKEMTVDKTLAQEVVLHRKLQESLGNKKKNSFRDVVRDVIESERVGGAIAQGDNAAGQKVKVRSIGWRKWAIAAGIVALLGFAYWQMSDQKDTGNAQLYAEFYELYPSYTGSRSEDDIPRLQEAMEYYNEGKFQEAAVILTDLAGRYEQNESIQLYAGISLLETGKTKEALKQFKSIPSASILYDQALWYQSMVFLKMDNVRTAKNILKTLANKPGKLGLKAKELLERI